VDESPLIRQCQANEFQQPSALHMHPALQVQKLWVFLRIGHSPTAPGPTLDAAVLHLPLVSIFPHYQVLGGHLRAPG